MVHANHVRTRIALVHVDENDEFVPADINTKLAQEAIWSMQNHELIHFTMCNPPFYTSQQEMLSLARIKKTPANAVSCRGCRFAPPPIHLDLFRRAHDSDA